MLQFNAVVVGNIHARHLYERLGFQPLGTIPRRLPPEGTAITRTSAPTITLYDKKCPLFAK